MSSRYLLEIGVEEFPAAYIDPTKKQLKTLFVALLKDYDVKYKALIVESTPRRFAVIIEDIVSESSVKEELVKGPSKSIAFDEDSNATKALLGFLRSQGGSLEDVIIQEFNGGEYVYLNKKITSPGFEELVEKEVPSLIRSIVFPKSMKWGGKNIKFARPIRWIVSMLDDEVLPFDLEGIRVSNHTKGHRFLGQSDIILQSAESYEQSLKENYVIIGYEERKEIIVRGINRLAKENGGNVLIDEALLDEVTNIVEYPTPLIGNIKKEYLSLPKEVIITPMKDHQRYFPVVDDNNQLMPYFITVRNGDAKGLDNVARGNEKVLAARLEDAKFFYEEDSKISLEDYVNKLKTIVFQANLGTMYDKTKRLEKLVTLIGNKLEVGDETLENLTRTAYLCKADLSTRMVVEFTELQGAMGRIYARNSKENSIVSNGIYEHYLPRFADDKLPESTVGYVLSIADKLDTIAGLYAAGVRVSGSQDPYGIRRSAIGVINCLISGQLSMDLEAILKDVLYVYVEENGLVFDYNEVIGAIKEFFIGRFKNKFVEEGFRYDIVNAVVETNPFDICDYAAKLSIVSDWLQSTSDKNIEFLVRIGKLTEAVEIEKEVNPDLFESQYEHELFNAIQKSDIDTLILKGDYLSVLEQLDYLQKPVNDCLDNVMVMVEDPAVRDNRIALLNQIYRVVRNIFVPTRILKSN